jgi:hypothetical protein
MPTVIDADYLVVGAGATGMAFTDALVDHADVRVALVDRRDGPGGHWLDDYSFVRLHQASAFYGVASTLLGDGRVQVEGPENGLHERASGGEVSTYFAGVLSDRMVASGKVEFLGGYDYVGNREVVSMESAQRFEVSDRCRVVDARLLSPDIPALTPPPFDVAEGARVVPVNDLVDLGGDTREFVIVGCGKTATDAVIWLLGNGVGADAIRWVRPREPWMLNRAVVQPDPAVYTGMVADTMAAASAATSADDLFVRLEDAGVMLRIDQAVTPTMAKTPTLAQWELDLLRQVEDVVRLGHLRQVTRDRLVLNDGEVALGKGAVVVHCAAPGLKYPPPTPVWGRDQISVQPIRAGFPCFGAALVGYVEATRRDDDEKNRLCPPTPLSNTPTDWCLMQVLGSRATAAFGAAPDIKAWADGVALNPARTPPDAVDRPEFVAALDRVRSHADAGLARLAQFAGPTATSGAVATDRRA